MTSPGLSARPPGMFSVIGTTPTTSIGAFSSEIARIAPMTAAPPAMSSFIRSMPSAGLIEMPPVSKVMPLPTSPSTGADAGARGRMAQHEHARRLGAAAGDAEQQAHPEPRNLFLVQDFDVKPRLAADGRATFGEHGRRQNVCRLVAQVAREVARFAEHPAALHRRFERGIMPLAGDDEPPSRGAARNARRSCRCRR